MKEMQKKKDSFSLIVLNEKGEVVELSKIVDSKSIRQERLRQSRIKFNLASILIAVSAAFYFTGVVLFWSRNISDETAMKTIDLVSRVVTCYCIRLIESAQTQLDELMEELKDESEEGNAF